VESAITRGVFYARASYSLTPNIEVYATANYSSVYTFNYIGSSVATNIRIFCGNAPGGPNAYLSSAINATCAANGVTSFSIGVPWDIEPIIKLSNLRTQRRGVVGADGSFSMFGSDWTFSSYFQHGENSASAKFGQQILLPHWNAAIDAVAGPNGTIICRANAVTTTAPGCAPFALFGNQPMSPKATEYVAPSKGRGPFLRKSQRQEAASFSMNGTPFKNWAGEVAVAFGAEYREEAYVSVADPYADGVTAINPYTVNYPADPTLNPLGDNWRSGNYHSGRGNYHVQEAFLELGIPLVNEVAWGKLDLNIAGRGTYYSTSGYVSTWKVGATWETPLTGLRVRALQSRDVRAPNLSELFASPITSNVFVNDRTLPASAPQIQVANRAVGNPNLKPESAQTTEVGIVYQPEFLPGFSISADYYRVGIKKQIGSLTAQQIVDLCQVSGNQSYCGLFFLKGTPGTANQSYVLVQPFNLAQVTADGFDIEASYQFDLQDWEIPGSFNLRGLAGHVSKFFTNSGVPGAPTTNTAGANDPLWKINLNQSWNIGPFSLNVAERFFSAGRLNPYGIVCQAPNCPAPTTQRPTFASMDTPSYLFIDVGGSYQFTDAMQAYFKINNVADHLPGPVVGGVFANSSGQFSGGVGFADPSGGTGFADPIGRTYTIGLRIEH
jgi:outer membrane receptor protein involved in Fe transport